jgi:hypothetical protein
MSQIVPGLQLGLNAVGGGTVGVFFGSGAPSGNTTLPPIIGIGSLYLRSDSNVAPLSTIYAYGPSGWYGIG